MRNKKNWKSIAAMALAVTAISSASTTAFAQEAKMVKLTNALTQEVEVDKIEAAKTVPAVKIDSNEEDLDTVKFSKVVKFDTADSVEAAKIVPAAKINSNEEDLDTVKFSKIVKFGIEDSVEAMKIAKKNIKMTKLKFAETVKSIPATVIDQAAIHTIDQK